MPSLLKYCLLLACSAAFAVVAASAAPQLATIIHKNSIHVKSYDGAQTIQLLPGVERTIRCPKTSGRPGTNQSIAWYFGNLHSLSRIHFDAITGRLVTAKPTDSSVFRLSLNSTAGRFLLVKPGYVNHTDTGSVEDSRSGYGSYLRFKSADIFLQKQLPNGILACSINNSVANASSSSSSSSSDASKPLLQVRGLFHLTVVIPLSALTPPPLGKKPCPLGYRLANYAIVSACYPCLPGEYSPADSPTSICLACPEGSASASFASPRCVQLVSRKGLKYKRLPLASFTTIIMYHFLLVLVMAIVVIALLIMAACSFNTVWRGVLTHTEFNIADVLEDRFVINQPDNA